MATGRETSFARGYAAILSGLVLLVVFLVGGLIWYNSRKTAELAILSADRLIAEISEKVMGRVQLLYDPMIAIVALASRVPDVAAMTHGDNPRAAGFLIRGLKAYPQIFSLYVGYSNGEFFMVSHIAGDQNVAARAALGAPNEAAFANERIELSADGSQRLQWVFLDDDGAVLSRRDEADVNYDPRQRQWYQLARTGAGAVARTHPYLFASSKQIGVTLSRSLDGPVEGAFGADVAIGELSRFLAAQNITPTSRVFIFNTAGEFVAGTDRQVTPGGLDAMPRTAAPGDAIAGQSDLVTSGLFEHFKSARPEGNFRYDAGGRSYLARISQIPERYGEGEYLAIAVPIDEIIAPITDIRTQTLLYSSAFLLFALPLYCMLLVIWIDRRLARRSSDADNWETQSRKKSDPQSQD
jgi:adenylate cyclase